MKVAPNKIRIAYSSLRQCTTALLLSISLLGSIFAQVPMRQGGVRGIASFSDQLTPGSRVYFGSNGAILEQTDAKRWTELGVDENPRFHFEETSRDRSSIVLKDLNRHGFILTVDLKQRAVKHNGASIGSIVKTTRHAAQQRNAAQGMQPGKTTPASNEILPNGKVYLVTANGTVGRGATKGALQNVVQVNQGRAHYYLRNQDAYLNRVFLNAPILIYFGVGAPPEGLRRGTNQSAASSSNASSNDNAASGQPSGLDKVNKGHQGTPTSEGVRIGTDQGFATKPDASWAISDGPHWTTYLEKLDSQEDQQLWVFERVPGPVTGNVKVLQANDKFWIHRASRPEMYLRAKPDGVLGVTNNSSERTVFTVRAATN